LTARSYDKRRLLAQGHGNLLAHAAAGAVRSDKIKGWLFLTFRALPLGSREIQREVPMAKATTIKVKLVSSADTGFYYVTKKNSRTMTDKIVKKKYDPVAKKHVEFREAKIK
jgi:large subunit ribosomal protein L33